MGKCDKLTALHCCDVVYLQHGSSNYCRQNDGHCYPTYSTQSTLTMSGYSLPMPQPAQFGSFQGRGGVGGVGGGASQSITWLTVIKTNITGKLQNSIRNKQQITRWFCRLLRHSASKTRHMAYTTDHNYVWQSRKEFGKIIRAENP